MDGKTDGRTDGWTKNRTPMSYLAKAGATKRININASYTLEGPIIDELDSIKYLENGITAANICNSKLHV